LPVYGPVMKRQEKGVSRMPGRERRKTGADRHALLALNIVVFLMSFGFYILYPLLANHLISWRKIAVLSVTFILNARIVTQDALMFPVGLLLGRMSAHAAVALGGAVRGIGFLLFTLTDSLPLLLAASLLTGVGGALFFPAMYTMYTRYSDERTRLMAFARRERLNSLGAVLGPIAGTLLNRMGFLFVGIASALVFVAASAYLMLAMPGDAVSCEPQEKKPVSLRIVLTDTRFLLFAAAAMLIMQIHNQMGLAIAVRIDQVDPAYPHAGLFSSLSSVIMVLLQVPALRVLNLRLRPPVILMLSVFLFTAGFLIMGFLPGLLAVYGGAVLVSLGAMLHMPTRDAMLSVYAGDRPAAAYYGFIGVLNTLGTLVLASGLGKLYDLSYSPEFRYAPWISLAVAGLAAIAAFIVIEKTNGGTNGMTRMKGEETKPC